VYSCLQSGNVADVDDKEVVAAAIGRGWTLAERPIGDATRWRWTRAADEVWPTFRTRQLAVSWMRERLERERGSA
jgi:hypothetical protein